MTYRGHEDERVVEGAMDRMTMVKLFIARRDRRRQELEVNCTTQSRPSAAHYHRRNHHKYVSTTGPHTFVV